MDMKAEAKLLWIFLGEADKAKHASLYEVSVKEARRVDYYREYQDHQIPPREGQGFGPPAGCPRLTRHGRDA